LIKSWYEALISRLAQVWEEEILPVRQAPHIDRTDFLNVVVREKKRFENSLDEAVAGGLNAGTDVLMNQVCRVVNKSDITAADGFNKG
jgi:hypothetical protein